MLTLAIIGAAVLTTTVIIFWNMPTKEDESSPSLRGGRFASDAAINKG